MFANIKLQIEFFPIMIMALRCLRNSETFCLFNRLSLSLIVSEIPTYCSETLTASSVLTEQCFLRSWDHETDFYIKIVIYKDELRNRYYFVYTTFSTVVAGILYWLCIEMYKFAKQTAKGLRINIVSHITSVIYISKVIV